MDPLASAVTSLTSSLTPTLGWMADATKMLTEGVEAGMSIAKVAAPLIGEIGEFAPLLLLDTRVVNIQSELMRYKRVIQETKAFGD